MIDKTESFVSEESIWVKTEKGKLFAKVWRPDGQRDRSPIILFHESLGCVDLWRKFPSHLASRTKRTVIAYDRLGFGRSDPYPRRLESNFIVLEAKTALPHLLHSFEIRRFIACGHSVGGGMAIEAAAAYPEACQSVVTIAAQSFVEPLTLSGIRRARSEFDDPSRFGKLVQYHGYKARWVLDAWAETWLSSELRNWRLDPTLNRLLCPVLAVHGDRDEFASIHQAELIAASGPRGSLVMLPDTGHSPHREQPNLLAETIENFLQTNDCP